METSQTELLFLDVATYCVFAFFCCLAFMVWYLRRNIDEELKEKIQNVIWLENIFYFRDFTRKRFGRTHFAYHLAIIFLVALLSIFSLNIFQQFKDIEPIFKYSLAAAVVVIIGLVVGLVYRLSNKQYYE
ncbi:hypothetical protein [Desulfopila aestuarii]|uniref:Uncharacterized protein n=1 Tax=Desulfopila aestuarii DSM 18488 TaxID=1121416 RepID=A0A1M7YE80_9BACT|nr:hypothetical protein [Desulfopila aestuarii]SHO50942.1 hypothetical protein SAMN02745220_03718 [Desulfopila aestuarii DSM 18488]